MDTRRRLALGVGIVVALFLFVQLAALALVEPFGAAYEPVENPQDPTNSLLYVGAILVATGLMLTAFKLGVDELIRLLIVGSGAWLSLYVFATVVPPTVSVGGLNLLAVGLAVGLAVALYVHPEWYVIDTAGAFMGAGAAGLFGISFDVLPALVLLTVLAVYDAISVYGTEHMLTLASGVLDLRVPVVLVIPLTLSYSFLEETAADAAQEVVDAEAEGDSAGEPADGENSASEGEGDERPGSEGADAGEAEPEGEPTDHTETTPLERDALFIGLGDAVIPTVLVASSAFFLADAGLPAVAGVPLPAVTAMVGTFAGLFVLLWMVFKGRAHAGLPLLNGGAIAGYVVGALASGLTVAQTLGLA